jgi:DNA polymerase III subunit gamma/tau
MAISHERILEAVIAGVVVTALGGLAAHQWQASKAKEAPPQAPAAASAQPPPMAAAVASSEAPASPSATPAATTVAAVASSDAPGEAAPAQEADKPPPEQLQAGGQAFLWHWSGTSFSDPEPLPAGSTVEVIGPWASDADYVEVWEIGADGDRVKRGVALRSTLSAPTQTASLAQRPPAPRPRPTWSPAPPPRPARTFYRPVAQAAPNPFRPRAAFAGPPVARYGPPAGGYRPAPTYRAQQPSARFTPPPQRSRP